MGTGSQIQNKETGSKKMEFKMRHFFPQNDVPFYNTSIKSENGEIILPKNRGVILLLLLLLVLIFLTVSNTKTFENGECWGLE